MMNFDERFGKNVTYDHIKGLRVPLKNENFKNNFLLIHGVAI